MLNPQIKSVLDDIIKNEEGGWKLTGNANDPDGGWTFAGITKTTWNIKFNYSEMAHHIAENFHYIQDSVYDIYDEQFIAPLQKEYSNIYSCFISAAINIGAQTTIDLIKAHKVNSNPAEFINVWQNHYIQLVKDNAEAWKNYALISSSYSPTSQAIKPKVLRAEDLLGWINRTRRYYDLEYKS